VTSGKALTRVGEEEETLGKDGAVYIPARMVHSLENGGADPAAAVNAFYMPRHIWKGMIEAFFTELDPRVEQSKLRYPSEI